MQPIQCLSIGQSLAIASLAALTLPSSSSFPTPTHNVIGFPAVHSQWETYIMHMCWGPHVGCEMRNYPIMVPSCGFWQPCTMRATWSCSAWWNCMGGCMRDRHSWSSRQKATFRSRGLATIWAMRWVNYLLAHCSPPPAHFSWHPFPPKEHSGTAREVATGWLTSWMTGGGHW